MTIVLTGGGSGGHITPILAVARELKQLRPDVRLVYIGQTGDGLADIPAQDAHIDATFYVRAGKFRRYNGLNLFYQLLKVPTQLRNIRDAGFIIIGCVQSYRLLRKLKPEVIFIKGGFVGVPVGLAAAVLKIPYITHDSDAIPGLANRIIARWATFHAVGQPKEVYRYPAAKTEQVGVPVQEQYKPVTTAQSQLYRRELGIVPGAPVVLVTGGGLGAQSINRATIAASTQLLDEFPDLRLLHVVGRANEGVVNEAYSELPPYMRANITVVGYSTEVYKLSGAADVIVTRAGATSLAEFAAQQKACIIVPNPYLTGGHQLKNTKILVDNQAVEVVEDTQLTDPEALRIAIAQLLRDEDKRRMLAQNLHQFARSDAAKRLAVLLLEHSESK